MKNVFLLFALFLLFSPFLKSQDVNPGVDQEVEKVRTPITVRHEIGVNGTYLIKQIISLSDTSIAVSPYLLTYKMMFNNVGIRAGIGGRYNKKEESSDAFEDSNTETNKSLDLRLGVEWQKQFHKRWGATFGLDFLYQKSSVEFVADSGFDVFLNKDDNEGYGFGPALGLYFHINKNISLYTEGAFYVLKSKLKNSQTFTNFPQFDDENNSLDQTKLVTMLPSTLYFVIRF